jgi:hypothetical protein
MIKRSVLAAAAIALLWATPSIQWSKPIGAIELRQALRETKTPTYQAMLTVTQLIGFGAGSGAPPGIFYMGSQTDNTDTSTYTFTDFAVGEDGPLRRIYVCTHSKGTAHTASSMTIGGISAELARQSTSSNIHTSQWFAEVPTGTTATIVVTLSTSAQACTVSVYKTLAEYMLIDMVDPAGGISTTSVASNIKVRIGGFLLSSICENLNATGSYSWTGADTPVTDYSNVLESGHRAIAGSIYPFTADSNTDDLTYTGSSASRAHIVSSWEPVFVLTGSFYINSASSTANSSSYTFNNFPIGKPTTDRLVPVYISWIGTTAISSVTIGGVSATVESQTGSLASCAIAYALVTSGQSCSVVVTFALGVTNCAISVYKGAPSSSTPLDTVKNFTGANTTLDAAGVAVSPGGFVIGGATVTGTATLAWSGTDSLVTDYTATVESDGRVSGHVNTTESASPNLTANNSENNDIAVIALSWV